jgi:CheY-like chemotaxis protein
LYTGAVHSHAAAASPKATRPGLGARILIADDVLNHRHLLRHTLESSGYEVAEAEDGEQAVERAPAFAPHLVILDINMPKMDGCTAAKALHAIPGLEHTPIIALTAATSALVVDEIAAAGFSQYLVKPVGPAQLRQCVMALL